MKTDPSKYIPTSADTPEQWIEWHKSLRKWFGKHEANQQWLRFWNQRAGAGSDADTYNLRSYMRSQDVDLTTTTSGEIADTAFGVLEWGAETINWIRGIIFGGIILGMALIAYFIIQRTRQGKTISDMRNELRLKGQNTLGSPTQLRLE